MSLERSPRDEGIARQQQELIDMLKEAHEVVLACVHVWFIYVLNTCVQSWQGTF